MRRLAVVIHKAVNHDLARGRAASFWPIQHKHAPIGHKAGKVPMHGR
jgi:hypothetical protein